MANTKLTQMNLGDRGLTVNKEYDENFYIQSNFQLYEMHDPTTKELILSPKLMLITQTARDLSGCSISTAGASWYRGEPYNTSIGGSPTSYHLIGKAHDTKWYKDGVQVHPLRCGYIMYHIARQWNCKVEIGVYFPGYDQKGSGGYLHFAVDADRDHFYYYDSNGVYNNIPDIGNIGI